MLGKWLTMFFVVTMSHISYANVSTENVKSEIKSKIEAGLPACANIKEVPLPKQARSFIKRCGGIITTTVRKKMYNLSSPVVKLNCSDFSGNTFEYTSVLSGTVNALAIKDKQRSGSSLLKEDTSTKLIDINELRGIPLCAPPDDYSYSFSRNVNSGVLYESYLRQNYAVRRGDMVTVLAKVGGIKISTRALAIENGYNGNLCKLRNVGSRKSFSARIVGFNEVEVVR
ncbi:flagellar basal body P-ring formation chaperone FlgA [Photobacterium kishitanii]|uniref:Flagella basal body P-ring formation protein FlgA n=1 Tax=Photobacterium kishitanii TaxID=318456 RepID=A0A2T3KMV2_9GAMM|nr:flagellar basal body P-ring formation chaperone FlgA [Photobacterium kishitanii]PSV01104.1 flagella basal body P-ring formation protein FlgA [Photobacterium kishitanii]